MISYYIIVFFFAIVVIVYWTRQNDSVSLGESTKGLLRMTFTAKSAGERHGRPGKEASSQPSSRGPRAFPGLRRHF